MADRALVVLLRLIGAAELAAVPFVLAPVRWMNAVHDGMLGQGLLPDRPVVVYLARHLSALYAIHGVLFLYLSRDLTRYRPVVRILGWGHVALGPALACTDISAGFHWVWAAAEGTMVGVCGALVLVLARDEKPDDDQQRGPGDV